MRLFNQDGIETICPIGIGLELSEASFKRDKDLKEDTEFTVVVFDIDHFEKLHCKVTKIYSHKTFYQIISKERYIPQVRRIKEAID